MITVKQEEGFSPITITLSDLPDLRALLLAIDNALIVDGCLEDGTNEETKLIQDLQERLEALDE